MDKELALVPGSSDDEGDTFLLRLPQPPDEKTQPLKTRRLRKQQRQADYHASTSASDVGVAVDEVDVPMDEDGEDNSVIKSGGDGHEQPPQTGSAHAAPQQDAPQVPTEEVDDDVINEELDFLSARADRMEINGAITQRIVTALIPEVSMAKSVALETQGAIAQLHQELRGLHVAQAQHNQTQTHRVAQAQARRARTEELRARIDTVRSDEEVLRIINSLPNNQTTMAMYNALLIHRDPRRQ